MLDQLLIRGCLNSSTSRPACWALMDPSL